MSEARVIKRLLERTPIAGAWLRRRRDRRRQRDWSTVHAATFGSTRLSMHTTIGIGDVMICKQVCEAFEQWCAAHGDPRLGHIVICAGAWDTRFTLPRGDHHVYWWWSMNNRADWLDVHLAHTNAPPDVVACLSKWCVEQVESRDLTALPLPLGASDHFRPTGAERRGVGFAGSKGHKDPRQEAAIVGPFLGEEDFEWVDSLTTPRQLSDFYNRKRIALGMTERLQESVGMVNNRVFEVLATDTPLIVHAHRGLAETLGFEYPYQSTSAEQTRRLAEAIRADPPAHAARFREFGRIVRQKHSYLNRVDRLIRYLSQRGSTA